jgi:hypothetical protein
MAKGGSFELQMCKLLSLWFSNETTDETFRRNRRGGKGDITYRLPEGKPLIDAWNIECKAGYSRVKKEDKKKRIFDWGILEFLDSQQSKPKLSGFWEQCVEDAWYTNREPVLIFRRPFRTPCIVMRRSLWLKLEETCGPHPGQYLIANIMSEGAGETLNISGLGDFFAWIDPEALTPLLKPKLGILK